MWDMERTGVLAASGVMALSDRRPPIYDAETRVQLQGGEYGLCGGKSDTGEIQFSLQMFMIFARHSSVQRSYNRQDR